MQRDLVERAMAGDHDAFSELARVSIGRLFVVAQLILADPAPPRMRPRRRSSPPGATSTRLRDPDRFDGWLHRLLVNACHREARGRQRRGSFEVHVGHRRAETPTATRTSPIETSSSAAFAGSTPISVQSSSSTTTSACASTRRPRSWGRHRAPSDQRSTGRPGRCAPRSTPTHGRSLMNEGRPA